MKIIDRADLIFLLCKMSDRKNFSAEELGKLLDIYGDDYFIEGNRFVKTKENPMMKDIRNDYCCSMSMIFERSDRQ